MITSIVQTKKEKDFLHQSLKMIVQYVHATLERQETCRIGLAGGSTPKKLYHLLGKTHLPWEKITLIVIDERNVSPTDPRSNLGMIRSELISNLRLPEEQVIASDTVRGYEEAAVAMEYRLQQLKKEREDGEPLFDLLILGAGVDGHIASIFPQTPTPSDQSRLVMLTSTTEHDIFQRMSVTMSALLSSRQAILLLKGSEKRHLVQLLADGTSKTPAGRLTRSVATTVFYHAD